MLACSMAYYKKREWETITEYANGRSKKAREVRHDFRIVLPGGRRLTKTFKNLDAGRRWAAEQERLVEMGADVVGIEQAKDVTLRQILERFLEEDESKRKSPTHASSCAAPLIAQLGGIPLARLTPEDIGAYRDERLLQKRRRGGGRAGQPSVELDRTVQPSTVKKELAFLARVIDVATKRWGYRLPFGNPARGVERPSEGSGRDRRLVNDEEERLLAAAGSNLVLSSAIVLLIETAARRGELWAIEWRDIDYERKTLLLRGEDAGASKTGQANTRRTVPLSPRAVDAFKALEPKREKDRVGKVFHIDVESISQAFERARKRAHIKNLTLHDLRHEATSRLFELGLNMMEVSTITGHKTLDMLRRYTQLRAEQIGMRMETLVAQTAGTSAPLEIQLAAIREELALLRKN